MKRKFVLLTLLMCILGGFNLSNLNAQTTVTIGDGSAEGMYSPPIDVYYANAISQQIFPVSSLVGKIPSGSVISKIAFKHSGGSTPTRNWSIYMQNSQAGVFVYPEYTASSKPVESSDKVYSKTFTITPDGDGWVPFDLTEPFTYEGGDLIITVIDNTGASGGDHWWINSFGFGHSIHGGRDAAYTEGSVYSFNQSYTYTSDIQLTFTAGEGGGEDPTPEPEPEPEPEPSTDIDPAKYYRIKVASGIGTGEYLTIFNNTEHENGPVGGVGTSAASKTYEQIFKLEKANDGGYYLLSQDGYYIYCQSWNVDALSNKKSSLSGFVIGSEFQISNNNNLNSNSSKKWFKVQYVSDKNYIFCDATSSNVTWTLEEAIVAEPEKPTAPTNLTANASSYSTIDLSWSPVANATSYNVYQGNTLIAENISETSFQVTELDGEKEYCFTVTAVNIVGESDPSEEECTTTPAEPVGCKIIFELRAAGDYGWGANGALAVYYTGGPVDGDFLDLTSGTSKTYSYIWTEGTELSVILLTSSYPEEMGLTIKYENGVVIRNYNIGEISSSLNNNMFLYRHIVECSTLPVPTVNAVAVGKSAIKLTWDNLGGASGYNVYDREGNLIVGNITGTTTTVYDLSASTEYCFTVTSIFEDEESEHSEEACATTSDSDTNSGTIGNGDFTTSYIPIETYNKYSYSQQSYTKGDIEAIGGSEGYITSIAYNVENVYTAINTRNIRVFMTNATNEITFTDGNGLTYPIQNSDLVFEGPVTFTPGWVEINFDTPFAYNGNNILVTVIDDTGETDYGDIYCYAHSKYTNTQYWSIRGNSADNKIDLASSLEGKVFQSRNDIKFTFTSPYADLVFDGEGNWNNTANWNLRRLPAENEEITITGNAVITNDVTINSITIDGGSLTVESGSLTVTDNFTNTDASAFVIEDSAQVFQKNDNVMATFRMNIKAPTAWNEKNITGWQFISSPMKDAATASFVPNDHDNDYDLFKYVGGVELEWVNYKSPVDNDFEDKFKQGYGYMASYEVEGYAEFAGVLNNETSFEYQNFNALNDADYFANFYLLGNPFAFDMKWNNNNIAASGLAEGYAVVTTDGSYNYATTGDIKVGDGFFVKVTGTNPSLSYTANTRNRNVDENKYINLIASNKAGSDNVIINFADNGRDGFAKLENFNKNIAEIYVKDNEKRYGILNYDEDIEEIDVYFNAKKIGYYTINAISNADFSNVTLIDRITGIETNILTDSYTFQATTNDSPERFIIRIDKETESENFVYKSGEELIINAKGCVQIIDVMGRIVYSNDIVNDNHRINISSFKNATYIVRVVNTNEVKTQKIVIW